MVLHDIVVLLDVVVGFGVGVVLVVVDDLIISENKIDRMNIAPIITIMVNISIYHNIDQNIFLKHVCVLTWFPAL